MNNLCMGLQSVEMKNLPPPPKKMGFSAEQQSHKLLMIQGQLRENMAINLGLRIR